MKEAQCENNTEMRIVSVFFLQAENGIRDLVRSRGLGEVYKRQARNTVPRCPAPCAATGTRCSRQRTAPLQGKAWLRAVATLSYAHPRGWLTHALRMNQQLHEVELCSIQKRPAPHAGQSQHAPQHAGSLVGPESVRDFDQHHRDSAEHQVCLLYTSPSPRDRTRSRMPSSA